MRQEADPVWGEAQAELQEAVKSGGKGGRPKKEETASHRDAVTDPTLGTGRQPTDRKSRLVRTLSNLKNRPKKKINKVDSPVENFKHHRRYFEILASI